MLRYFESKINLKRVIPSGEVLDCEDKNSGDSVSKVLFGGVEVVVAGGGGEGEGVDVCVVV